MTEKKQLKTEKTEKSEKPEVKKTISELEAENKISLHAGKDILDIAELDEEKIVETDIERKMKQELAQWIPKTELGRLVKEKKITDIEEVFRLGKPILEVQIVDTLLPNLETDLLMVGQSKGKFGGGARRVFRQTQKKTNEGNKPSFATMAVVGNKDGYVGVGYAKSKETVPAREKALRRAKLNIFSIKRGSGSWQSSTSQPHSIPFTVTGKAGSVILTLMPAPVGKGLIVEKECKKILELAGIKDLWSRTSGHTNTKINLLQACVNALKQLNEIKVTSENTHTMSIISGKNK